MNGFGRAGCEAFFLASAGHTLFSLLFVPPPGVACAGAVLHLPAFAEEMNKSRRAVANTARCLAQRGWYVLVVDPRGTGDSSGDFADATWAGWLDDLHAAARWLQDRTGCVPALWGLRAGALLASELLPRIEAARLILWQPVLSGEVALSQFLRLRTMSGLADAERQRESVKALLAELASGVALQVAGYTLAPALALPMRQTRFDPAHLRGMRVAWLEVSTGAVLAASPASEAALAALRSYAAAVELRVVPGLALWSTQEIDEGVALTAATVELMDGTA